MSLWRKNGRSQMMIMEYQSSLWIHESTCLTTHSARLVYSPHCAVLVDRRRVNVGDDVIKGVERWQSKVNNMSGWAVE
jgi:hypothetical protein